MNWKYCILNGGEEPLGGSDIIVWTEGPAERIEPFTITIDAIGAYLRASYGEHCTPGIKKEVDHHISLGRRLLATKKPYWMAPYPGEPKDCEWCGSEHMIMNIPGFTRQELALSVRIYLQEKGFVVSSLKEGHEWPSGEDAK
jgi:hypothetical protein